MLITMLLGLAFAMIRIVIGFTCEPTQATWMDVFKDIVHVYMGGLGLYAWNNRGWSRTLFWSLCVIEVVVAIWQRM